MSVSDAERFVADVAKDKQLAERVKPHAAGLAALAAGAKALGYNFTVDELKQVMRGKAKQDLNDAIAGGNSGGSPPPVVVTGPATAVTTGQVMILGPAVQQSVVQAVMEASAVALVA